MARIIHNQSAIAAFMAALAGGAEAVSIALEGESNTANGPTDGSRYRGWLGGFQAACEAQGYTPWGTALAASCMHRGNSPNKYSGEGVVGQNPGNADDGQPVDDGINTRFRQMGALNGSDVTQAMNAYYGLDDGRTDDLCDMMRLLWSGDASAQADAAIYGYNPLGYSHPLRFWYSHGRTTTGAAGRGFQPRLRNVTTATDDVIGTFVSSAGGDDVAWTYLDLAAPNASNTYAWRLGRNNTNKSVGPLFVPYLRATRPDLSGGFSCTPWYRKGQTTMSDMQATMAAYPGFWRLLMAEEAHYLSQYGGSKVLLIVNSGINDDIAGTSKTAWKASLQAHLDDILIEWTTADATYSKAALAESDLSVMLMPAHHRHSLENDQAIYDEAMIEVADDYGFAAAVINNSHTGQDIADAGWFQGQTPGDSDTTGYDPNHLNGESNGGYVELAKLILDDMLLGDDSGRLHRLDRTARTARPR